MCFSWLCAEYPCFSWRRRMANSPVLALLVYGGYAHYSKVSTYWRDSLLLTQLCTFYQYTCVTSFCVQTCSHPFTRGRKNSNMCENIHCFWSFDASHAHHYNACTYNICSYYDKINVKFKFIINTLYRLEYPLLH